MFVSRGQIKRSRVVQFIFVRRPVYTCTPFPFPPAIRLCSSPIRPRRIPVLPFTHLYIYISPEITNYIYKAVLLECWTIYYGCRSKSQYLDILCNILPLYMIEFSARKLYLLITMKQTYNYQMQYSSTSVFVYITVLPLPPKGERC